MSYLRKQTFLTLPAILAIFLFGAAFAFLPDSQSPTGDPGVQATVFEGVTVSATPQSAVVACGQGAGSVGRKTLSVWNGEQGGGGAVTVTAELRNTQDSPNFTSGYLAVNNVATDTLSSDTSTPSEAAGRFCQVTAVSAVTGVITVTLRRE